MKNVKPVKVPIIQEEQNITKSKNKNYPYREVIGSLLYISTKKRPDIAFEVTYASRYVEEPTQEWINNVKHILKYLKENVEQEG